jgi:hypothetical protein
MNIVWEKKPHNSLHVLHLLFLTGKILPWKRRPIGPAATAIVSTVHRCRHLKLNLLTVQKNDMCFRQARSQLKLNWLKNKKQTNKKSVYIRIEKYLFQG